MHLSTIFASASLLATAYSHGLIQIPPSRPVGPAILSACGSGVVNQIKADNTSHVEGLPEAAAKDKTYNAAECNLWLCKGLQFADNPAANIQKFTAGQVLPMKVWIRIPHKGEANVSIVDTKTNTIVGVPLKTFTDYADGALESQVRQSDKTFNVTIPDTGDKCTTAGECVLQWWWYGDAAKQTYESCVDFAIVPKTEKKWVA